MGRSTDAQNREYNREMHYRALGAGGGEYAVKHTARAYPWWIVVYLEPLDDDMRPRVARVQAAEGWMARQDVERRNGNAHVVVVAREEWRRL